MAQHRKRTAEDENMIDLKAWISEDIDELERMLGDPSITQEQIDFKMKVIEAELRAFFPKMENTGPGLQAGQ
jgi:hypothetical protein